MTGYINILFINFFVSEYSYVFLYEGSSYTVDYNDSIVVRFAHNNDYSFYYPDSIRYQFIVTSGQFFNFEFPSFRYVFRSGTVPYTGELHIDNIQFSHTGEYTIHDYNYYYHFHYRRIGQSETFVITINSESCYSLVYS